MRGHVAERKFMHANLPAIAGELNAAGIKTPRGGQRLAVQVQRVLARLQGRHARPRKPVTT